MGYLANAVASIIERTPIEQHTGEYPGEIHTVLSLGDAVRDFENGNMSVSDTIGAATELGNTLNNVGEHVNTQSDFSDNITAIAAETIEISAGNLNTPPEISTPYSMNDVYTNAKNAYINVLNKLIAIVTDQISRVDKITLVMPWSDLRLRVFDIETALQRTTHPLKESSVIKYGNAFKTLLPPNGGVTSTTLLAMADSICSATYNDEALDNVLGNLVSIANNDSGKLDLVSLSKQIRDDTVAALKSSYPANNGYDYRLLIGDYSGVPIAVGDGRVSIAHIGDSVMKAAGDRMFTILNIDISGKVSNTGIPSVLSVEESQQIVKKLLNASIPSVSTSKEKLIVKCARALIDTLDSDTSIGRANAELAVMLLSYVSDILDYKMTRYTSCVDARLRPLVSLCDELAFGKLSIKDAIDDPAVS